MIFTVDIGNSSINAGIYKPDGALALSFKLSCDQNKSSDEYAVTIKNILDLNAFSPNCVHHAGHRLGGASADLCAHGCGAKAV